LLKPLVSEHPLAFFLVKNIGSLTTFYIVSRFSLFRIGHALVGFNVLGYLCLDMYWLILLWPIWMA
ncbi:MAG: hypothetical protein QGI45_10445, partial [Myxococcota bacterium]|nr:hypothetical protein [Myxococcota bacterium]